MNYACQDILLPPLDSLKRIRVPALMDINPIGWNELVFLDKTIIGALNEKEEDMDVNWLLTMGMLAK